MAVITGTEGNDYNLEGTDGDGADTVIFSGLSTEYSFARAASQDVYTGGGLQAGITIQDQIDGRDGTDTLVGAGYLQFADGIFHHTALMGHERTSGGDGNDTLTGGTGNDSLFGLAGDDSLMGEAGNDLLDGGAGNDSVTGDAGNDSLLGAAGDDVLNGGSGDDTFEGGAGNDLIETDGYGDTVVFSGNRTDYLVTSGWDGRVFVTDTVEGRDGSDELAQAMNFRFADGTFAAADIVPDPSEPVARTGSSGNDFFKGGSGNDSLYGGKGGDDTLEGRGGDDVLDGGYGSDTVVYRGNFADYEITLEGDGSLTVRDTMDGRDGTDRVVRIEYFRFQDDTRAIADIGAGQHFVGTNGSDTLLGGKGSDLIEGLGLHDYLSGSLGRDTLYGGDGSDTLDGGDGNDLLVGGNDHDTASFSSPVMVDLAAGTATGQGSDTLEGIEGVAGSPGNDTLLGDGGANWLSTGDGNDFASGAAGNDALFGGNGNDTLSGGSGRDQLHGGAGTNTAVFQGKLADYLVQATDSFTLTLTDRAPARDGADEVTSFSYYQFADGTRTHSQLVAAVAATAGPDTINGTPGGDTIHGLGGNDRVLGNEGDDYISGDAGHDSIYGGTGNDGLAGGAGNDLLDGGAGIDTAIYVGATVALTINLADARAQRLGSEGRDTLLSIENVRTGSGNDSILGNAGSNDLDGGAGNDILDGGAGPDFLDGGAGNDTLDGGTGPDFLHGGKGDDTYFTDGLDVIDEAAGFDVDTVVSTANIDALPSNVEKLTLIGTAVVGTGNNQDNVITGNALGNQISGADGNDRLFGGPGNDLMSGGAGDDVLNGQVGADTMQGGDGNDTYFVDAAGDAVQDDAGTADTVFTSVNWNSAGMETIVLQGTATRATGDAADNTIVGTNRANTLDGGDGADTLRGAAGNDVLHGGQGADVLDGGAGADFLTGGAGADTFCVGSETGRNVPLDRILDFNAAEDRIQLDNSIFKALPHGELAANAFQAGAGSAAGTPDVRIIFNTSTGALLYDSDGTGRTAAVLVATVTLTGTPLTADHIEIV